MALRDSTTAANAMLHGAAATQKDRAALPHPCLTRTPMFFLPAYHFAPCAEVVGVAGTHATVLSRLAALVLQARRWRGAAGGSNINAGAASGQAASLLGNQRLALQLAAMCLLRFPACCQLCNPSSQPAAHVHKAETLLEVLAAALALRLALALSLPLALGWALALGLALACRQRRTGLAAGDGRE